MPVTLGFYLLQSTFCVVSVLLLLSMVIPGVGLGELLGDAWRRLRDSAAGRRGALLLLATGATGYAFNRIDPWFTELAVRLHGVEDFAVFIVHWEGGLTARLQAWAPVPLIAFFLYVYVSLFPALYAVTMLAFVHRRQWTLVSAGAYALAGNYLLALPFFLFLSVREVWFSDVSASEPLARLLIDDLSPHLEPLFRTARGIENNFPSLHTSVAATAALLAWRSGIPRLTAVIGTGAALVAFSTLYLGFHWVTDMIGGLVHAAVCTYLALRAASRHHS